MTQEEAEKVLAILNEADGGCPFCVDALVDSFKQVFPEFDLEETPITYPGEPRPWRLKRYCPK